ncbi:hypothetical protein R1flu_020339 [Riccia fluitans]|uniref:Uncharacterized protein n=1 Tax=Riccia fluitans TaxID=41844 RepID=A0ABD1ZMX2_9MARC
MREEQRYEQFEEEKSGKHSNGCGLKDIVHFVAPDSSYKACMNEGMRIRLADMASTYWPNRACNRALIHPFSKPRVR